MNSHDEIIQRVNNLSPEQQLEILETLRIWQAGEKRVYKRISEPFEIDVLIGDKLVRTVIKNISASGVYIKTTGKIDAGKDVRVCFSIPGAEKPFKLEGSIVRSESDGLAVAFKQISSYLRKVINTTVWPSRNALPNGLF